MKPFEAVLSSLLSLTEDKLGASDRDGQASLHWLETAVAAAAAELQQLVVVENTQTTVQQKVCRVQVHTITQHTHAHHELYP